MIVALLLGAGTGAGAWLVARALSRRPPPLRTVVARLERPGVPASATPDATRRRRRVGVGVAAVLSAVGVDVADRREALALVGRSPERHALDKLAGGLAGAGVLVLVALALARAGVFLAPGLAAVLAAALGAAGFAYPDWRLREQAEARRRTFRHALSAYVDLVNVILAGGGGIETALHTAAEAGEGWAFARLRRALTRSRLTNRTPWDTFAELGGDLGVPELEELAASVAPAGSHGARIRQSLVAKADTIRGHQIAETEAAEEAATERMTIPVAILLFGNLVFIGWPAVAQITTSTP